MQFHEKLKAYRISAGWTQEQLAEKIYVSRVTVSKWETGRGFPNLGSLQHIAALFSVTVDDLLSTDELVTIVQDQVRHTADHFSSLIFGILDFSYPAAHASVFNDTNSTSVGLLHFSGWFLSTTAAYCNSIVSRAVRGSRISPATETFAVMEP